MLVILLTAFSSVETAVEAMKQGAYHYANKPFNLDEIALLVAEGARDDRAAPRGAGAARVAGSEPYGLSTASSASRPPMRTLKALLQKVASSPASTVLLTRRERHRQGPGRQGHPLQQRARGAAVHEHHLLGAAGSAARERAVRPRARRVHRRAPAEDAACSRSADGGTVFLDEIGEMVPALQAKLLRFLEEKAFKRVGGSADIRVDVRVIAATNRDLEDEVKQGQFREDLYYRLNVHADRAAAAARAPGRHPAAGATSTSTASTASSGSASAASTPEALELLEAYAWPGNVRELRNAVERAMLLAEGDVARRRTLLPVAAPRARLGADDGAAGGGHQSRDARARAGRPGARAHRLEPDEGGGAARAEPGPDSVSHREVRPRKRPRAARKPPGDPRGNPAARGIPRTGALRQPAVPRADIVRKFRSKSPLVPLAHLLLLRDSVRSRRDGLSRKRSDDFEGAC